MIPIRAICITPTATIVTSEWRFESDCCNKNQQVCSVKTDCH